MGGNGRGGFEYSYWIAFSLLLMCCLKACNCSINAAVEVHGCIERERKALLQFKGGVVDHFGMLSSWGNTTGGEDDDDDCCHWGGVECDNHTGHVISLDVHGDHVLGEYLGGKIVGGASSSLAELQHLKHLNLSGNEFEGIIPAQLGNLSNLQSLDLSWNNFGGIIPAQLGNLSNLQFLDLGGNHFGGEIPKSWRGLCSLRTLDLSQNILTGLLEEDFLACSNNTLEYLGLSYNQLRGSSFPHLNGFSQLKVLLLGFNQLNGTLPQSIGQLTLLEWLDIGSNSLQGTVSANHLFGLSNLTTLDLSFNSLTFNISLHQLPLFQAQYIWLTSCKLGPRFPNWLRNQKCLSVLDISASGISDSLPNWILNLSSNLEWLNISNNHISGPFLDLQSTPIFGLDTSSNCLEGSIPQSLFSSTLRYLDLSKNMFSGSISLSCKSTDNSREGLFHLDLSDNRLSGKLPKCWDQWKDLRVLNLENNNFSGKIGHSIGLLESIQSLHLRNNSFIGALPSSLNKCVGLRLMDLGKNKLSGRIPAWIGGSLSNLIVLNLGSNQFNGNIPVSLCRLENMKLLDLSSNNLSGTIPKCLNNLTAMANQYDWTPNINYSGPGIYAASEFIDYTRVQWKGKEVEYKETLRLVKNIDFSNNKLTGEIPAQVTDLIGLVALNLSRNRLSGPIPSTIGQLQSLDFLDLSHNQLNGGIPNSLAQVPRLGVLDLSDNNLSGKIPSSTQLQSFNASTYEENPGLCGPPLPEMCPEDDEDKPKEFPFTGMHGSKEDEIQDVWFYGNMVLGFITGFWGVCGSLLLNRSWRIAYFKFLNNMKDRLYVATTIHVNRIRRSFQS